MSPPKNAYPKPRVLAIFVIFLSLLFHFASSSVPVPANISQENDVLDSSQQAGLAGAVEEALVAFEAAVALVSGFSGLYGDRRLTSPIEDYKEVVDYSIDELNLVLRQASQPEYKQDGDDHPPVAHSLQTWLSAALNNQDTCLDGFDGTDSSIRSALDGTLQQLTSLVADILSQLLNVVGRDRRDDHEFSTMHLGKKERRLLEDASVASKALASANVVVAKDGSGQFSTVTEAVEAAPTGSPTRYVIYVKKGTYRENVLIGKKKINIMLIGEGMGVTVITGDRSFADGWTTFRSATFAVAGSGFIARDITFENTAGATKHQAVAARVDSDLSVFFRVSFLGYQDTLYARSQRQFYRECEIHGTVDFIFGNAQAVFQNCLLLPRADPLRDQKITVTAQGRKDPNQNTGFSFQFCKLLNPGTNVHKQQQKPVAATAYLGRPWKKFSRTVVMQSYLSDAVQPQGWLEWNGNYALNTLYYAEYLNYGPGAALGGRVKWPGFHVFKAQTEAVNFTVARFLDGNSWLPSTRVRYTSGLSS